MYKAISTNNADCKIVNYAHDTITLTLTALNQSHKNMIICYRWPIKKQTKIKNKCTTFCNLYQLSISGFKKMIIPLDFFSIDKYFDQMNPSIRQPHGFSKVSYLNNINVFSLYVPLIAQKKSENDKTIY